MESLRSFRGVFLMKFKTAADLEEALRVGTVVPEDCEIENKSDMSDSVRASSNESDLSIDSGQAPSADNGSAANGQETSPGAAVEAPVDPQAPKFD